MDAVSIGYGAAVGLTIPLFHSYIPGWATLFVLHAAFCLFGLEAIRSSQQHPNSTLRLWLRCGYPACILVFGFVEVGKLQHYLSGGNAWLTDYLIAADYAVFGVHPTVWFKQFYNPWLDEFMSVFRVCYFLTPLLLWPLIKARRTDAVLGAIFIVITTYTLNYVLFLLLPAVSPRMVPALADPNLTDYSGFLFASLEHMLQGDKGAVRGAAFPSAHCSATVAWTFVVYRYMPRWAGHAMIAYSIGTAVAAVYLGFHHAMDPLGGVLLALITCPLAIYVLNRQNCTSEQTRAIYVADGVKV